MNKGILFALLSGVLLSSSFVIVKYLLHFSNPYSLAFYWFVSAFFLSTIGIIFTKQKNILNIYRHSWKDGVIIGLANTVSVLLWYNSINLLDPSIAAFVLKLSTIFIVILGVVILKEKLSIHDVIGLAIAMIGTFIISDASFKEGSSIGIIVAVGAAISIAIQLYISKIFIKRTSPLLLVNFRTFYTMIFLLIIVLAFYKFDPLPVSALPLLVIGPLMSAVLGFLFFYKALELGDISQASIIRTVDPFIVLIYSFLIFRTMPSVQEILGGILIVLGVILTISESLVNKTLRKGLKVVLRARPWFS